MFLEFARVKPEVFSDLPPPVWPHLFTPEGCINEPYAWFRFSEQWHEFWIKSSWSWSITRKSVSLTWPERTFLHKNGVIHFSWDSDWQKHCLNSFFIRYRSQLMFWRILFLGWGRGLWVVKKRANILILGSVFEQIVLFEGKINWIIRRTWMVNDP